MLYKIILSGGLTSTEWNEKWKKKKKRVSICLQKAANLQLPDLRLRPHLYF